MSNGLCDSYLKGGGRKYASAQFLSRKEEDMTITKGSNGFRHYYPIIRFGLLPFLVLLIILVIGAQPGSGPMRGLGAFGKYSGSGSIGLVDMQVLERAHPGYDQLRAIEEQMLICQEQWYDYIELVAQQARLDGLESPFLMGIRQGTTSASEDSMAIAELWEEARGEREQYQEKLHEEIEADLEKQKAELEERFAEKVESLQRQTRQEIVNRQVELALLTLKESEAERLLDEISQLQANLEKDIQRLQEAKDGELQSKVNEANEAALKQLELHDQALILRTTARIDQMQSAPVDTAKSGNGSWVLDYPEALWREQLGHDYRLNTGSIDALEAQLLQERSNKEARMRPLQVRYEQIRQEIERDLEAGIAEAAKAAGLALVLDKSQMEIQGIDITNQVLVILQGEA